MESLIAFAKEYGALGMVILACFWYIVQKDKAHKDERAEMMNEIASQHREALTSTTRQHKEALQVTKNNTTVLTEIATLIKKSNKE